MIGDVERLHNSSDEEYGEKDKDVELDYSYVWWGMDDICELFFLFLLLKHLESQFIKSQKVVASN